MMHKVVVTLWLEALDGRNALGPEAEGQGHAARIFPQRR
jgi:hypothetical protein